MQNDYLYSGGSRNRNNEYTCTKFIREFGFCSSKKALQILFKWCGCIEIETMAEIKPSLEYCIFSHLLIIFKVFSAIKC